MKDMWVEHLMKHYSDSLFQYVAKHTDSREDAEDIHAEAQEKTQIEIFLYS